MDRAMDSLSLNRKPSPETNVLKSKPSTEPLASPPKSPSKPGSSTLYPKILKLGDFLHATKDLGPLASIHLTGSVKLQ